MEICLKKSAKKHDLYEFILRKYIETIMKTTDNGFIDKFSSEVTLAFTPLFIFTTLI